MAWDERLQNIWEIWNGLFLYMCFVFPQGKENNFNKISEDYSSLLNTSYDYTSVMHYDKDAFSNGNGSTIITKQPEFQDVIGNSIEMSSTDALELNRLYHCGKCQYLTQIYQLISSLVCVYPVSSFWKLRCVSLLPGPLQLWRWEPVWDECLLQEFSWMAESEPSWWRSPLRPHLPGHWLSG